MQRVSRPLTLIALVGLVFWATWPEMDHVGSASPASGSERATAQNSLFTGAISCAATACHNGNGPAGSKGSEYTTWITRDKHARAYETLFNPDSERIIRNLHGPKARPASETTLCLKCHVHPDATAPHEQKDEAAAGRMRRVLADGVGCGSCHGPAQGWLATHYLPGWRGKRDGEKGIAAPRDTRALAVRAETCVRCHVGHADADVNHDLIAAGHPRLRFEFGAYHANLPKHWQEQGANAAKDFQARAWAVGQLTSAKAAAELLAHRAADRAKPWPEFAEYGCFACHHDLKAKTWRQQRRPDPDRPAGSLPWGTWYLAMPPMFERVLGDGKADVLWMRGILEEHMRLEKAGTNRAAVAREAGELANVLRRQRDQAAAATFDEARVRDLLGRVAGADPLKFTRAEWDAAVQVYLGAAALHHALADGGAKNPALQATVRDLGDYLDRLMPRDRKDRLDSPAGFDPDEVVKRLEALRAVLSPDKKK